MKFLIGYFFLASSFSALAEVIDGPANLRVSPRGEVAVSLVDGVQVYVDAIEGDWFKVSFVAYVSKDDYGLTNTLKAGVELMNYNGNPIGQSKSAFSNFEYFEEQGRVGLFFSLYTYKTNIVKSSILESEVASLINARKLNRNSLLNLQFLKIEKWVEVENYQGGIVMEPLTDGPFPPGIRFIFFIQNQEVVAIVGNNKMNGIDFERFGKTEIEDLRLNVYYLDAQVYSNKERFEKSLFEAFSKMW